MTHLLVTDAAQLRELEQGSAILREMIAAARLETITDVKLASKISGRPGKAWLELAGSVLPALRIPYFEAGGRDSVASALKPLHPWPANPNDASGTSKAAKYLRPKGFNRIYLSPDLVASPARIVDPTIPKLVIEGEKKVLAAASYGYSALGISGVDNWGPKAAGRARKRLHDELAMVARAGGEIFLIPDADQAINWHVATSMGQRLADELARAGGHVFMVRLPERGPKGLDDILAVMPVEQRATHLGELLARAREAGEHVPADLTGGRVTIAVGTDEERVADEAMDALASAGEKLNLYRRGPSLARVGFGETLPPGLTTREPGAPSITLLSRASLREMVSAACFFERPAPDPEKPPTAVHPPEWLVAALHDRGRWDALRHIAHVTEVPQIVADGRVVQLPGYDVKTGIYFAPRAQFPVVPDAPSSSDVAAARVALEEVVCDFHFATEAHRSAWIALVLTLVSRFAFDGVAPLFLVDANSPGTGKGLLVDVAALIATGRTAALSTFVDDDVEMGKRILGWAIAGTPLVALDNVTGTLGGNELCKVLTSTHVDGRILGSITQWSGELNATWCATANNAQLGTDMHRRVCHVRVLADSELPEERSGFKHADLRSWTRQNHPRLAAAALTILRAALVDQRDRAPLAAWNSYEGWNSVVRRAIVAAGWPDPAGTRQELRETSTSDRPRLQATLVARWAGLCAKASAHSLTAKRAIELLFPKSSDTTSLDEELRDVVEALCGERVSPKTLGFSLREMRSRVFGGMAMVAKNDRNGVASWSVAGAGIGTGAGSAGYAGSVAGQDEEWLA